MDQQTNNCAQCNKPKASKSSGSITQWVFGGTTCRCDAPAPVSDTNSAHAGSASGAGSSSGSTAVTICPKCKKPEYKAVKERGSITQWVMRSNACVCLDVASDNAPKVTVTALEFPDQGGSPDQSDLTDQNHLLDQYDERDTGLTVTNEVPVKSIERNFGPLAVMLLLVVLIGGAAAMVSSFLDKPAISEIPVKKPESETVDEKWDRAVKIMDTNIMPAFSSIAEADLKRLRTESDLLPGEPDLLLRGTDVTDGDLLKVKNCKRLIELDLSDTKITDAAIPNIVQAKSIRKLLLNGVKLKSGSLELLSSLPLLEELQLDNAGLADEHLEAVSQLKRLRVLKVTNNSAITDSGVRKLTRLTNLQSLDVTGTKTSASTLNLFDGIRGLTVNGPSRLVPSD